MAGSARVGTFKVSEGRRSLKGGVILGALLLAALFTAAFMEGALAKDAVTSKVEIDRPVLLRGQTAEPVYLLLRLSAMEAVGAGERPPLNMALVLDRSGSMADAGKLDYVKKAATKVINTLGRKDVLSIIEYDDQITIMWPAGRVESASALSHLIDGLTPRGSTNLTGGMMAGVDEVKRAGEKNLTGKEALNRVLLLSDGLANDGITDPGAIRELVRKARRDGVPISTLGLGRDYDEDLMQDIAENAGGRYYYIENPEQMSRIFAQELNALFKTVARNCVIEIKAGAGVKDVKIFGFESDNGAGKAVLGDIYGGEKRTVLVRLEVDPQRLGHMDLGALKMSYADADDGAVHTFDVNLGVEITDDVSKTKAAVNHDVAVEATLAETERAQNEAVKLYEAGKHDEADKRMQGLITTTTKKQAELKDVRVAKKLEALNVEAIDMKAVALAPEAQSEYLKRTKQRLYQAKQGQRQLSMMQTGDKGYEVERLQEALAKTGYYSGPVNGVYDGSVADAVTAFQKAQNLGADGMAGPATMKGLGLY